MARPRGYSRDDAQILWRLCERRARVPALGNVDCGHTDPILTLPLGCPARRGGLNAL